MKFTNFDKKMFKAAHDEALKSDYDRIKVGCVITYKHTIIGRGCNGNRSHPMQKAYNRRYRKFNNCNGQFINDSIHAEICALNSISFVTGIQTDFSKCNVYIFRVCPGKKLGFGNSKPCSACYHALKDCGFKSIFFTSDEGYSYLEIAD